MIERFRAEKDRRGLLDYEDLIDKTLDLLNNVSAAWVHYKLDRGIDHVLIDEAQDTSPKQWEIVKALVGEFFAGAGAHDRRRTIFAVGDEKQSIFSFQGAAPREFDDDARPLRAAAQERATRLRLDRVQALVPLGRERAGRGRHGVHAARSAHAGLSALAEAPVHEALPQAAPGLVEIWDTTKTDERKDIKPWDAPFDTERSASGVVKLAKRIAKHVAQWRSQGRLAKDVLVLVRRRGVLFESIIRALKNEGVPVAGADRLVLTEHIAVMDLMALADALLLPAGRSGAGDRAEKPAVRARRGRAVRARLGPQEQPAQRAAHAAARHRGAARRAARTAARTMTPFAFYAGLLGAERRPPAIAGAARPRGRRRARRIPQPRARLRAQRDAVAARLRGVAALGAGRGEARHGDGARRGAGDDGARRQGPRSADRHPRRHHDAAAGLSSAAAAAVAGRTPRAAAAGVGAPPRPTTSARWRRRARRRSTRRATNTGGCSMSR